MSIVRRLPILALLLGVSQAPALAAQTVAGVVVDSASGRPLSGVTIVVRSARDSVFLRGAVTDEGGRFTIPLPRAGSVVTSARRIGLRTSSIGADSVGTREIRTYRFEMVSIATELDTVRAGARRVLKGMFYELTAGQQFYAEHSAAGKGFFTSGLEVRVSGMTPCEFLAELPGFGFATVVRQGITGIGCYWNRIGPSRYIVPTDQAGCIEAYVDRKHRVVGVDSAHFITTSPVSETMTWRRLDHIRGIELFAKYEDRPKDFAAPSREPLPEIGPMATRTGIRSLGSKVASEAPKVTTDLAAPQQRCALMLIWTEKYWG
jgi:hypothetical protein